MAASSSSAPPYTGEWKYDCFVCFRGDTRHRLTSHLEGHLRDNKIDTFIDNNFPRAHNIDGLLKYLAGSAVSVVVFSPRFADSSFCLNEVAVIADSMERFGHRVVTVFSEVEPEQVTGQYYGSMIDEKFKPTQEVRDRWIKGLNAVVKCAGHTSKAIP